MLVFIIVVLVLIVAGITVHTIAGEPVALQEVAKGASSDILYICIPGTGPCSAYPFNAIRDRVLLKTGDVMYIKYPEHWFSFDLSTKALARIIETQLGERKEIRIIAGSLGAKIAVGSEALLPNFLYGTKITNYLISPTFGVGSVRWGEMIRSGLGSNRDIDLDPEMDKTSQGLVEKEMETHKLLYFSQLLASFISVKAPIHPDIETMIIGTTDDWLTDTHEASHYFIQNINQDAYVALLPLKTHCELLKEAHIYCEYFEETLSN